MSRLFTAEQERAFWSRVDRTGDCWEWTGSRTKSGYGNMRLLGQGRNEYAHRYSLLSAGVDLPQGMHVDHLCRNRACVRPEHLEVVTPGVNARRGAASYSGVRKECRHGHDITLESNVYIAPRGDKRCRACARQASAERTAKSRAKGDLRKALRSHCIRGHAFDQTNTAFTAQGRRCRACDAERAREYRKAKAA